MDQTHSERAELDRCIEKHARHREDDRRFAEMWAESERRDRERRRWKNRAAWYGFHMQLYEVHARISGEHEERALALLEELGGGGGR